MSEKLNSDPARGEETQASPASSGLESVAHGVASLIGQGVGIGRPPAGETVVIQSNPGDRYAIEFDPGSARVSISGGNLQLNFNDGSRLVFESLVEAAGSGNAPIFDIAGAGINSALLLGQAGALTDETLETAAGANTPLLGGGGDYVDDLGTTISLLGAQDVLGGTELEFGLITLEDVVTLLLPEAESADSPEIPPDVVVTFTSLVDGDGPVGGSFAGGFEDWLANQHVGDSTVTPTQLTVTLNQPAGGTLELGSYFISDLPPGATLFVGGSDPGDAVTVPPGGFLVTSENFDKVFVLAPSDSDIDQPVTITANVFDPSSGTITTLAPFVSAGITDAAADQPSLNLSGGSASLSVFDGETISLPVQANFGDTDGSETHSISITGVPRDWTLLNASFGDDSVVLVDSDPTSNFVSYQVTVNGGAFNDVLRFDPNGWTSTKLGNGSPHGDGAAEVLITAQAQENPTDLELTSLNDLASAGGTQVVDIPDSGQGPAVTFALQGDTSITEGGAPGNFSVAMTGDSLGAGQTATVRLSVDPDSVSLGVDTDQTLASLIAEIATQAGAQANITVTGSGSDFVDLAFSGSAGFGFDVQALVDSLDESSPNESFTLSLGNPTGNGGANASIAAGLGSVTTEIIDAVVTVGPSAEDNINRVDESASSNFNLLLALDASSSMLESSGVGALTRFDLMVESFQSLLLSYQATGAGVTVQVIEFGGFYFGKPPAGGGVEATISAPNLSIADALTFLGGLAARPDGSGLDATNYRAATKIAIDNFTASASAEDIVYFATDGIPTAGKVNVFAWEKFLGDEIRAIGVGIGVNVNADKLEEVAFPNVAENLVLVPRDGELSTSLQETLPGAVSGNVIADQKDPGSGLTDVDDFGSQGAGTPAVTQLTQAFSGEGTIVFSAASAVGDAHVVSSDGRTVTLETDAGGRLTFDFVTGNYVYLHPPSITANLSENFTYTIQDGSGSLADAVLTIEVTNDPTNDGVVTATAAFGPAGDNLAPLAEDDTFVLKTDGLAPGKLIGNIIDGSGSLAGLVDSDADGDALSVVTVSATAQTAGFAAVAQTSGLGAGIIAAIDLISNDGEAEIQLASDGTLTLTEVSGNAFAELGAGAQVVLALDYSIADGRGGSDSAAARLLFVSGGGLREEDPEADLNALA